MPSEPHGQTPDDLEAALRRLTIERAELWRLAEAGEALFAEILQVLQDTIRPDGSGDYETFARRLNEALNRYAPAAAELRRRRG